MTTFATTARPPTAAIAWATKDELFVEIPTKSGPPYICRYRKTVDGLSAALNILIEHQEATSRNVPQDHPAVKKSTATPRAPWATDEQRQRARDLLKRLKIT